MPILAVPTCAVLLAIAVLVAPTQARAQPSSTVDSSIDATVPALAELVERRESSMALAVQRFSNDLRALYRRYDAQGSPERRARLTSFHEGWREAMDDLDFDALDREGRVDWILLSSLIDAELPELEREGELFAEMAELLPFADPVYELHEDRRRRRELDASAAAQLLDRLSKELEKTTEALERGVAERKKEERAEKAGKNATETSSGNGAPAGEDAEASGTGAEGPVLRPSRVTTHRAAGWTGRIAGVLKEWYEYRAGYDPVFTWWVKKPYEQLAEELEEYRKFLRHTVLEFPKDENEDAPIIGDPIGRDALLTHLRRAFIVYTPEELIAIAERDLEWGISEMKRAARDMGFGDGEDWKQALEKVKTLHVEPGEQPRLVRDLAYEATEFLEESELLTIPELVKEVWRIEMMSPERQKMNPFFLGGEVIRVSFPTDTMTNEEKRMSMRGNNIHFSRATVHHELIPGHHLQGFMNSRYNSHRRVFGTPFWTEGWALYWELRLWDLDFPRSPEDRIGMLFWRMHRDARVIWSLKFHLGEMTAEECVEFLVERIGHERENALAEVRRSLEGRYSPIYQLAYLMGGFQFRALHRELVENGGMDERSFHDAILEGGPMPVEMVRARLADLPLSRGLEPSWRYADP